MFALFASIAIVGAVSLYTFSRLVHAALPILHGGLIQLKSVCKILRDLTEQLRLYNESNSRSSSGHQHHSADPTLQQELRFLKTQLKELEVEKTVVTAWSKSQADEYNKNINQLVSTLSNSQAYNAQLTSLIETLDQRHKKSDGLSSHHDNIDHDARHRLSRLETKISHKFDEDRIHTSQITDQAQKLSKLEADYAAAEKRQSAMGDKQDKESEKCRNTAQIQLQLQTKLETNEEQCRNTAQLQLHLQAKLETSEEQYRELSSSLTDTRAKLEVVQGANDRKFASICEDVTYLKSEKERLHTHLNTLQTQISHLEQVIKGLEQQLNKESPAGITEICGALSAFTFTAPKPAVQSFIAPNTLQHGTTNAPGFFTPTTSQPLFGTPTSHPRQPGPVVPTDQATEKESVAPEDVVMGGIERDPAQKEYLCGDKITETGSGAEKSDAAPSKPPLLGLPKETHVKPSSNANQPATHDYYPDDNAASSSRPRSAASSGSVETVFSFISPNPTSGGMALVEQQGVTLNLEPQRRTFAKPRGQLSSVPTAKLDKMKSEAANAPAFTHYTSAYLQHLRDHMLDTAILASLDDLAEEDDDWIVQLRRQDSGISERELIDLAEETRHALSPYTREILYDAMDMFCEQYVWAALETIYEEEEDLDQETVRERYMEQVEAYLESHGPDSWNARALQAQAQLEIV